MYIINEINKRDGIKKPHEYVCKIFDSLKNYNEISALEDKVILKKDKLIRLFLKANDIKFESYNEKKYFYTYDKNYKFNESNDSLIHIFTCKDTLDEECINYAKVILQITKKKKKKKKLHL